LRPPVNALRDPALAGLLTELSEYPTADGGKFDRPSATGEYGDIVVPLRLAVDGEVLSLISMTTVFGSPVNITLSEVAIEAFLPADTATAEALRRLAAAPNHVP